MHAEEVAPEPVAASFGEDAHRDSRGVAGDDAFGLEQRLEPPIERLLRGRLLDDRLEDEITVREQVEGVVEVAERDEPGAGRVHEGGGPRLAGPFEARARGSVAVAVGAGDVEEHDRDAGGGGEGGDAAPHGAGADDAELGDAHVTEGVRGGAAGSTALR